ncbi:glucosidase 2 subunit beta-like [Bidens hawaiensis]|uniref:glucosidase 2 subunit beta-like n=1 Tax=Bidens hawaiensis TaxID=980011 RepID=UPI00404A85F5
MKTRTQSSILLLVFSWILLLRSAVVLSDSILGVAPQDEAYYGGLYSSGKIQCRDGSKSFTKAQLNDDFCDCSDATDEPGTSACPAGRFYCRNSGHSPLVIFSSRVNDGICDCCDGSDEYDGKVKCKNTCWEAGKVARDRLRKKITAFREGLTVRKHEVEQAKLSAAKEEEELSRLKNEENILKGLVQQLKERKEQIEKAEEKERIQKENEEKKKREAEEAKLKEQKAEEKVEEQKTEEKVEEQEAVGSKSDDEARVHDHSLSSQDLNKAPADIEAAVAHHNDDNDASHDNMEEEHVEDNEELSKVAHEHDPEESSDAAHECDHSPVPGSKEDDASEDTDSLSREELGRVIGSRWTGKKTEEHEEDESTSKHYYEDDDDLDDDDASDNAHDEEYNGYDTETEEDHHKYEDDDHMHDVPDDDSHDSHKYGSDDEIDMSDFESTSNPSWLVKIQQTVRKFIEAVNPFQTPVDTSESENVRKEYDDASGKLSKMQSRITSLTKKLGHDFGLEKEFYSLYGHCFEIKENKYVYKVCPYKEAIQEEGHSTTRLGQWDKFDESHRVMFFSNGDKCWNGPQRSLTVRLRCGSKVELADIDEPSRCEYSALLTTPALCQEGRLKELEDKLEAVNKDQPHGHDEL